MHKSKAAHFHVGTHVIDDAVDVTDDSVSHVYFGLLGGYVRVEVTYLVVESE